MNKEPNQPPDQRSALSLLAHLKRSAKEKMHPTEAKVSVALEACRPLLTEEEYREVFDFNDHAEWGIAIEALTDILGQKEVRISKAQLGQIEDAFSTMNLNPGHRTEHLRELMAEESS